MYIFLESTVINQMYYNYAVIFYAFDDHLITNNVERKNLS